MLVPFSISGDLKSPSVLPSVVGTATDLVNAPGAIAGGAVGKVAGIAGDLIGEDLGGSRLARCEEAKKESLG